MNKKTISLLAVTFLISSLNSCVAGPNSENYKKEMNHIQKYLQKDTIEDATNKDSDVNDLSECPILIATGKWEYLEKYRVWTREQSWRYDDGMVNETNTGAREENTISPAIENPTKWQTIYLGPWKDVELTNGPFWNRVKIKKKIRFSANQKKNDENLDVYSGYEFMNEKNKNIPEYPFKFSGRISTNPFSSLNLCEVKWVAKYGYNAIFDRKTGKIIEAKE